MKRTLAIALALVLALSLAACSGGNSTPSGGSSTTPPSNSTTTTPPASQNGNNNGDNAPVGDQWPSNDYTAVIPKPAAGEFEGTKGSDNSFIIWMTWTVDEAKAYADTLKGDGWEASFDKTYDDGSYEFQASKGGYSVSVNENKIQISKL
jgi:hypothetical protein